MKFSRFFPLIMPLLVFLFEEIYFFFPRLVYVAAILINLAIFFAIWQFCRISEVDKAWWNYLILPAVLSTLVLSYSVFISSHVVIQLLFIFNLVFLYLYLKQVYYYLLSPASYEVFSIENISSFINWLSYFLLAATIYGLQSFLNLPVFWLILIMLAVTILIIYQIIWVNKIELKTGAPYLLVACLILTELSWSISFLPFNYNISGLGLAICYYVIIGLIKNHLLDKLDEKRIKMYLLLGSISLGLLLFTARWL